MERHGMERKGRKKESRKEKMGNDRWNTDHASRILMPIRKGKGRKNDRMNVHSRQECEDE